MSTRTHSGPPRTGDRGGWKTPCCIALLACVFISAVPDASSAQPYSIDAFPIPSQGTSFGMAADSDGSVWYTSSFPSVIGHVSPTGHITEYPIPTTAAVLSGIVIGPDHNVWFGEWSNSGGTTPLNRIGRVSRSGSDFHEYAVGDGNPRYLRVGPDDNIWFTNGLGLGRITVDGDVTLFDPPSSPCFSDTYGLTIGPDGALWVAVTLGRGPARFDLATHEFLEVPVWSCGTTATDITTGPDGNLWLTDFHAGHLFRVTPSGLLTTFDLPGNPFGIVTVGGDLFVARSGPISQLSRIDPFTGVVLDDYPTPTPNSLPENIAVDSSDNIWFNEQDGRNIGRLSRHPLSCIDALALRYENPRLTMRFALKSETPALWGTWLFVDHIVVPLWFAAIPPVSPVRIFDVPLAGFPPLGFVAVATVLVNASFEVCGDVRVIDTGSPN